MERTIKDPTFNIYKKGGNVEDKQQTLFDLDETDKANNIELIVTGILSYI